jgi:hypothetical protein
MDPSEFEFRFNLLQKIRYGRQEFDVLPNCDDFKKYRIELYKKGESRTQLENQELIFLTEYIRENDQPCIDPNEFNDKKHVKLSLGLSDEMFEYLIKLICTIINNENEWVCLYHVMIYRGWMYSIDFYLWVDWLNDRLLNIGMNEVLQGSSRRMISKYFTSPDRYQWTLEGYQKFEKTQSAQSINKLHRYAMVCKQICNILEDYRYKLNL